MTAPPSPRLRLAKGLPGPAGSLVDTARRHPAAAAGLAIVAFYAATRLALLWRFPLFGDEALYATWAWIGAHDPNQRFIALANGKDPLLTWIGMPLVWAGVDPLTALRLVSVGAGLAVVGAVAWIGWELGGRRAALVAAVVAVVFPFAFVHDVIGIMEPLVTATGAVALALQIPARADAATRPGAAARPRPRGRSPDEDERLLRLCAAAVLAARLPLDAPGRNRRLAAWLGASAVAVVLGGILHSVVRLSNLWSQQTSIREAVEPTHSISAGFSDLGTWLDQNLTSYESVLADYLTVPLVVAAVVGLGLALRRRTGFGLLLLAWVVLPIAAATLVAGVPYPRYILLSGPPLCVLAGYGIVGRPRRSPGCSARRARGWPSSPPRPCCSCPRSSSTRACSRIRRARSTRAWTTGSTRPARTRATRSAPPPTRSRGSTPAARRSSRCTA